MKTKVCNKCLILLPIDQFLHYTVNNSYGIRQAVQSICNLCKSKMAREHYYNRKLKQKSITKVYRTVMNKSNENKPHARIFDFNNPVKLY